MGSTYNALPTLEAQPVIEISNTETDSRIQWTHLKVWIEQRWRYLLWLILFQAFFTKIIVHSLTSFVP